MKCSSLLFFVLTTCFYLTASESEVSDVRPKCRETDLHSYTKVGYIDEMKEHLRNNPEDMYQEDCNGKTPVHLVVEYHNSITLSEIRKLILAFINADFNLHHRFAKENTILFHAVKHGNMAALKTLLEFGSLADELNYEGSTPLSEAVKLMRKDVCQLLVENGANISRSFSGGDGYLHRFVDNGTTEQVSLLLELGAPMDMKNEQGLTAIDKAILRDSISMLNIFLIGTVGCNLGSFIWREHLDFAISNGTQRVLAHLLSRVVSGPCWLEDVKRVFYKCFEEKNFTVLDLIFTERNNDFLQTFGMLSLNEFIFNNNTEGLDYLFKKGFKLTTEDVIPYVSDVLVALQNLYMVKYLISHSLPMNPYHLDILIKFANGSYFDEVAVYLLAKKDVQ